MKYWRGYLVALIAGGMTWLLMEFAKSHQTLVDMVYPYVSRMLQNTLADWSAGMSACLWQVLVVGIVLILVATIVLMVLLRWNLIQWFGWVLAGASCLFLLHTGLYGLNSYASPLADDVHLETGEYAITETELVQATVYFRDKANELSQQVDRDGQGDVRYAPFASLANQAGNGFETLTYEKYYSVFAGNLQPVKELGWADLYTSMGITGVTMPLTGEAAVNPQIPAVSLPFTMCHEMAHRMCIALERDANFAAFLACDANNNVQFRYSAYFMAFRYCYNALASYGTSTSVASAKDILKGVDKELQHDLDSYNAFFNQRRDEKATELADKANDTYIKASGDEEGIKSYDQVSDLLVRWYVQEIVLPSQVVEEIPFDPYNPEEVDLSGIVNAKVPENTEPQE